MHTDKIRAIKPGDPLFKITGKLTVCNRAGLEIDTQCPTYVSNLILDAVNRGWLKPIAYVTERELIFQGLTNETQ